MMPFCPRSSILDRDAAARKLLRQDLARSGGRKVNLNGDHGDGVSAAQFVCECAQRFRRTGNQYQIAMALRERAGEGHSETAGGTGYKSVAVVLHFSSCSGNGAQLRGIVSRTRRPRNAW